MFGFHAKVNSPFIGEEPGTFSQEILRPYRGFWVFQDLSAILTPGDIIHYWTLIVKDGIEYTKRNQTWKVPDPDESVDLLSPVTLKPSPEKMVDAEPTTQPENETPPTETSSTNEDTTPSSDSEPSQTSTPSPAPTTESTTPKTTPTTESTTPKPTPTTKMTPATKPTTTTTKKPPATTEKPKPTKPKKSTPAPPNPLMKEDVEELTTPAFPFDKPISSEFPEESPSLFPFPSLFPRPFKPMMPPTGPGFEICSNPWNFEEQPGESRTQRLERQVAKLQCQLALFQRGYTQLGNNVENELTDLKKLIYGMVARMARLESVIRSSPFG
ncbi:Hydrolase activity protein [Homalodisca vitripennis]|nr:Hydrolase activity protein [Homalodisca vitripennis]